MRGWESMFIIGGCSALVMVPVMWRGKLPRVRGLPQRLGDAATAPAHGTGKRGRTRGVLFQRCLPVDIAFWITSFMGLPV